MTDEELDRMAEGFVRLRWEIIVRRRDESGNAGGLGGVTPATPQALALRSIVLDGPLRMSALAEVLRVSVATASRTVDALVADGYVDRRRDQGDGRVVHVAATQRGRRAYATQQRRMAHALGELMSELSEDDRRELAAALETVNRLFARPKR